MIEYDDVKKYEWLVEFYDYRTSEKYETTFTLTDKEWDELKANLKENKEVVVQRSYCLGAA